MNLWRFFQRSRVPAYPFYIKGRDDIIRIHITKTAGTSFARAMKFNNPNREKGIKKHYTVREVINLIGQDHWNEAFKFTFVRNPWDRLFSLYRFLLRKGKIPVGKDGFITFKQYMNKVVVDLQKDDSYKKHAGLQVEWLKDNNGKINLDFIGRFENLNSDLQKLSTLMKTPIRLSHVNQSFPIVHYSTAYDDELEQLVRTHYAEDIATFNYTFDRI